MQLAKDEAIKCADELLGRLCWVGGGGSMYNITRAFQSAGATFQQLSKGGIYHFNPHLARRISAEGKLHVPAAPPRRAEQVVIQRRQSQTEARVPGAHLPPLLWSKVCLSSGYCRALFSPRY